MAVQTVNDQLPLQGIVLCCTALLQDVRSKLGDTVTQMGAIFKLDLTCDVTHLIVGGINTPKYRYVAKERPDIKVLDNDWVEAVRQRWMEGGEVNVEEMENQHRLPTFHGLKICITGFEDMSYRNRISDIAKQHGAEYHSDLTKAVTHLIAAFPQGAKYTHAKQWGLKIVSMQWFEDSIRRGMALDESLYDPVMPVEEQGREAFRTEPKPRTSLGKRTREIESQGTDDTGKRKLRRTASTRLHSQSQDMWQDISAREGEVETTETDVWKDESETASREQSMQPPSIAKVQVRRSGVFQVTPEVEPAPEGLFSGRYILIRGFPRDKASRLQQFLEPNGACVVGSTTELEDASSNPFFQSRHLLVPHALSNGPIELPEIPAATELVTEWWVERCIHYKRFFEPSQDALSRPLWDVSIPSFAGVAICTTGFPGVDFRQIAEAVKLLGASYEEKLIPHVSVLISGSENVKKEKAYYAAKHNITVVSADWLWECLKLKQRVAYDDFKIRLPAFDPKEIVREPSTSSPAPSDMLQRKSSGPDTVRDDAARKRLSNTRLKRATPSLSMQATKPAPLPVSRRPAPFVHEDDDDDETPTIDHEQVLTAAPSPRRSQVLQELSPNKSPRKTSQDTALGPVKAEALEAKEIPVVDRPSPMPVTAPQSPKSPSRGPPRAVDQPSTVRPQEELAANLASLLQQQKASREDSGSSDPPLKRKNRPLGRSASGIGNRSASASAQSDHVGSPALPSEISDSVPDGFSFSKEAQLPPPSTQLGYGTADGDAHTAAMEKRMKVKLHDEGGGKRVASVGVVKDSVDGDAGVGNRVRGRHRTKT